MDSGKHGEVNTAELMLSPAHTGTGLSLVPVITHQGEKWPRERFPLGDVFALCRRGKGNLWWMQCSRCYGWTVPCQKSGSSSGCSTLHSERLRLLSNLTPANYPDNQTAICHAHLQQLLLSHLSVLNTSKLNKAVRVSSFKRKHSQPNIIFDLLLGNLDIGELRE